MNTSNWQTYLVTQESLSNGKRTVEVVEAAIDGGVDVVQLREKDTDARWRYELGRKLRERTAEAGVALLVNDRVDIAQAIDADGVHLGQSDLPVAVARDLLGPEAVIGCSTATVEEAIEAEAAGADYLGVGAIYGTDSKKNVPEEKNGTGLELVSEIAATVSIPVIGIGGVTASNAPSVLEAGATGVAMISEITAADDPATSTREVAADVSGEVGSDD
ncbi:thiamine phosphate synthase [Natrinema hispanicum]|uniref:Thiamine-phosphate synthase n=1 Tax=Natrinema hispanicum TaxID=392421 RepID=A0A1G6VKM1_9EURY|nr:thiamine phosphate synthase [Natrinema hispanicum]SDD54108.1 thiamine-phosphate diphosphorylase [Natrinema hispanicum]SET92743.1 thiamine-phosphate diphosphorylase [Natrinema hispanicum]